MEARKIGYCAAGERIAHRVELTGFDYLPPLSTAELLQKLRQPGGGKKWPTTNRTSLSRPLELSFKHRAFVEAYCVTWRPQEAAIAAGYSRKSAHVTAYRLLENARIRAAIEAKLRAAQLSADHILARLSEIANANFGDFLVKTADGQIPVP